MGRPLNSKFFGPGADKLSIVFNPGDGAKTGFIIKQLGTSRYKVGVPDSSDTYIVELASTTAEAETLAAGKATIAALTADGTRVFVTKLESTKFQTTTGEHVVWAAEKTVGGSSGSIVTVGEANTPPEPEVPEEPELVSPDPTFIGELSDFQVANQEGKLVFFGTNNDAYDYVVSRNDTNKIELGLKVHKKNDGLSKGTVTLVGDTVEYHIPAEPLVVENEVQKTTWVLNYAVGSAESLAGFVVELEFNLDPLGVAPPVTMTRTGNNGDWFIGETRMMEVDSTLASIGDVTKVDQNATNIGYVSFDAFRPVDIDPQWAEKDGTFEFTLRAKKDGVEVASAKIKVITSPEGAW